MERIELFDRYIDRTLSEAEIVDFNKRLDSDYDFATEFKAYLLIVRGVCQEVEQENIEFWNAMKSMNKTQLQCVIGKKEKSHILKLDFLRERMIWISSMAAMLIVAFGVGWNIYISSQNKLCDVVYSYAYKPIEGARNAGEEYVDLDKLTDEQIKTKIPRMIADFEADEIDSQDWHIDGMTLAMAYLKLHQKNDAVKVLKEMASQSKEPEKYIRLIEQLQ